MPSVEIVATQPNSANNMSSKRRSVNPHMFRKPKALNVSSTLGSEKIQEQPSEESPLLGLRIGEDALSPSTAPKGRLSKKRWTVANNRPRYKQLVQNSELVDGYRIENHY